MNNQDIVKEEISYEDELDGLMKIRKEKLEELQKEGKNPFDITKYDRTDYAKEIVENFKEDEEKLKEVYKNLLELKQEILIQISEIISEDDGNLTIYMNDGQKIKVSRANFAQKLNYYDEISKYIDDKKNTTLNLINGAYLETSKSEKQRIQNIKNLLAKNSVDTSNDKERTTSESQNKEDNSSSDKNTTQNRAINSQNNNQASTQANKRKNT